MNKDHLNQLEAESIHIMREVVATFSKPVMLYSIGKDSSVMLRLAQKAFYPGIPPFPLLHIDTTWKFPEMYKFRDIIAKEAKMKFIIHINKQGVAENITPFTHTPSIYTHVMKTQALKQALDQYDFDVAFGGARRDEEMSRAKERIFSLRGKHHRWNPKKQRPELWNLYNTYISQEETMRVFPLSNWTEIDVWNYIEKEKIPVVSLYFSSLRPVVNRSGTLIMIADDRINLTPDEKSEMRNIRFRTLGCYPLSGAIESKANNVPSIIKEMLSCSFSERQGRLIDFDEEHSMERKKQEGYF